MAYPKGEFNLYLFGMKSAKTKFRRQKQGLLHLSSKADYGFLLLIRLAQDPERRQSLRMMADENGLSFFFLQKVALDLRKGGLIKSGRGTTGGYLLSKSADKISLKDIIEALDGPLAIMGCLGTEGSAGCARGKTCELKPGFALINQTIIKALSEKSLYDLINTYGRPGNKRPARKSRTD